MNSSAFNRITTTRTTAEQELNSATTVPLELRLNSTTSFPAKWYDEHTALFWSFIVVCALIALVGMIGNGFVIYVVSRKQHIGALRYLNEAVKSLAFTDFCFGLLGAPLTMIYWFWGKSFKTVKVISGCYLGISRVTEIDKSLVTIFYRELLKV